MEQPSPKPQKRPLSLDWNTLLDDGDGDASPPQLVLKPSTDMAPDQQNPPADGLDRLKDHVLKESIQSKKSTLESMGSKLPDKGEKLRATIKRFEEELSRRKKLRCLEEDVDEIEKPVQVTSSSTVGMSNDLIQENSSSQAELQSSFASIFNKKMEDDDNCTTADAFSKEISHFKHCNNQKMKDNRECNGRKRCQSSSRQLPFRCPSSLSKHNTCNDDKSCKATSTFSLPNIRKNLSGCLPKMKDASQPIQSDGSRSRKGQPIVLDDDDDDRDDDDDDDDDDNNNNDDDEPHILEKTDQENKFAEYMKEAKIYYPSSEDPESVEICYLDIDCLAPGGYLTSTIMNFYIRYLQQQASLTNRSISDYHFFNTYFYKKLKEAVSYKKSGRETFFMKFRRWWKGVNIFQKAYILIPIHEDLHWSLVIICIPNKEDESGPIILHLDSLGLHSSASVFTNIKSYLVEERNYLDRECVYSDVPISDKIWRYLPRRIEDQVMKVPQQKNDYDCGLFVLYFIERFIEEAPERLKRKDLAMFGKRWFKPEEASRLREKIRELLVAEFHDSYERNCNSESSPSPSAVTATKYIETAKNSLI